MSIFNIYNIEKIYLAVYLIGFFYVIYNNPINIIPFSIFTALLYIPMNILIIKDKCNNNINISDLEIGHRIIFIAIGLIPMLALSSEPVKQMLEFK